MSSAAPISDPRGAVREPLRSAIDWIIAWGVVGYVLAVVAVTVPAWCPLPHPLHEAAQVSLPIVVAVHLLVRSILRLKTGAPTAEATARAWSEARDTDPSGTRLAAIIVAGGSLGLLIAMAVFAVPHLANDTERGMWAALYVPILAALWGLATVSFAEGSRDRLAHALEELDRRFRAYWAALGQH